MGVLHREGDHGAKTVMTARASFGVQSPCTLNDYGSKFHSPGYSHEMVATDVEQDAHSGRRSR